MTKNPNANPPAKPAITVLPVGTNQLDAIKKLEREADQATTATMANQARKLSWRASRRCSPTTGLANARPLITDGAGAAAGRAAAGEMLAAATPNQ